LVNRRISERSLDHRLGLGRRQHQQEFIACGLRSSDDAGHSGKYVSANVVIGRLEQMQANAKAGQ
jgi:hypothetical protein